MEEISDEEAEELLRNEVGAFAAKLLISDSMQRVAPLHAVARVICSGRGGVLIGKGQLEQKGNLVR